MRIAEPSKLRQTCSERRRKKSRIRCGKSVYRRFGVEQRWRGLFNPAVMVAAVKAMASGFWPGAVNGPLNRVPADLLIDAQGRIAIAHYGQHLDDHLPLTTIERWLAEHHRHE